MKVNRQTDYLLVFDDAAVELRNGEHTYRCIVTRLVEGACLTKRLAAFNATGVDDLLGTAALLGLPIKLGYFERDGISYGMLRRLERAIEAVGYPVRG